MAPDLLASSVSDRRIKIHDLGFGTRLGHTGSPGYGVETLGDGVHVVE
jgi:hypothetical protein